MLEKILINWSDFYEQIKDKPDIEKLDTELERCYTNVVEGIEPHDKNDLLKGLRLISLENLKVVVLGNKPLLKSNGFAFGSYNKSKEFSKIFEELEQEFGEIQHENSNDFTNRLTKEGVLFIDVCPTSLMKGRTNIHASIWNCFIEEFLKYIYNRGHLVWLIWSNSALKIMSSIAGNKDNGGNKKSDNEKRNVSTNILLKCAYPYQLRKTKSDGEIYVRKFEGCNHFILCNNYLKQMFQTPITWVQ